MQTTKNRISSIVLRVTWRRTRSWTYEVFTVTINVHSYWVNDLRDLSKFQTQSGSRPFPRRIQSVFMFGGTVNPVNYVVCDTMVSTSTTLSVIHLKDHSVSSSQSYIWNLNTSFWYGRYPLLRYRKLLVENHTMNGDHFCLVNWHSVIHRYTNLDRQYSFLNSLNGSIFNPPGLTLGLILSHHVTPDPYSSRFATFIRRVHPSGLEVQEETIMCAKRETSTNTDVSLHTDPSLPKNSGRLSPLFVGSK